MYIFLWYHLNLSSSYSKTITNFECLYLVLLFKASIVCPIFLLRTASKIKHMRRLGQETLLKTSENENLEHCEHLSLSIIYRRLRRDCAEQGEDHSACRPTCPLWNVTGMLTLHSSLWPESPLSPQRHRETSDSASARFSCPVWTSTWYLTTGKAKGRETRGKWSRGRPCKRDRDPWASYSKNKQTTDHMRIPLIWTSVFERFFYLSIISFKWSFSHHEQMPRGVIAF